MKLFGNIDRKTLLYNWLIVTFIILYGATAFVSWYHAITFFNIANASWLSILLSFVAEIGQASVLFSILLTENKSKWLPWLIMIILTTLQVIGNVVSSYSWIVAHNSEGVEAFQKSILFWVQAGNPEMFQVIIAWISGALLPIIALSMTSLVAQNMQLKDAEKKTDDNPTDPIDAKDIISEVSRIRPSEEDLEALSNVLEKKVPLEKPPIEEDILRNDELLKEEIRQRFKDIMKKSDEVSPTKIISNEPPEDDVIIDDIKPHIKEVLPQYSDEELNEMFLKEVEEKDDLDEEVERLTPEGMTGAYSGIGDSGVQAVWTDTQEKMLGEFEKNQEKIQDEISQEPINNQKPEEEGILTQNNGLIELETVQLSPVPSPTPSPDDEEKKRLEEEHLENIRRIARENLKKK